ncbi:MAG: hypothetical protein KAU48_07480 [Candidatus Thorarchaeota archaeon]|nr:hypothetical protein [Candidatus Thorarchaeota archaeon]
MNLEMDDELRKKLASRFVIGIASLFTYLPVIAGILTPMLWLLPMWYSAWFLIGFIFPFSPLWGGLWLPISNPLIALLVFIIGGTVFFVGLTLFIRALVDMIRNISSGIPFVTSGLYRWVRHPQHLGIIMFLLPLALFNISCTEYWTGIRPGDLLSWSLVSFILVIVADIEEIGLAKRFGPEYADYCNKTSFLIPRVSIFGFTEKHGLLSRGKPMRYIVWFVLYWCIVSVILYGFTFVELVWTR